jgi:hypothetical protein
MQPTQKEIGLKSFTWTSWMRTRKDRYIICDGVTGRPKKKNAGILIYYIDYCSKVLPAAFMIHNSYLPLTNPPRILCQTTTLT